MFHMLTCFNLKSEVEIGEFRAAYMDFVEHMRGIDLVEGTGPATRHRKSGRRLYGSGP
jgi:hypothetical protein